MKNIKKPDELRIGQNIFNFLSWLKEKGHCHDGANRYMADPFYLPDEKLIKLYERYLDSIK